MARIFLEVGESFALASSNSAVFGGAANETLIIMSGVSGITTNQNTENISFSGALADYKFAQAGNTIKVYDLSGTTLVASTPVQGDSDGTVLVFGGSNYSAKLSSGVMSVGSSVVGATPAVLGSSSVGTTVAASQFSSTNNSYTATANTTDASYQSLYRGLRWTDGDITYSFNSSKPADYITDSDLAALSVEWRALNTQQQGAVREAMTHIENYTNLEITEVSSGGDIRLNSSNLSNGVAGVSSTSYYGAEIYSNDVFYDNDLQTDTATYWRSSGSLEGGYGWNTIFHEIGHSIGFKHPFENGYTLPSALDNWFYTIMSYTNPDMYVPEFTLTSARISYDYAGDACPNDFTIYDVEAMQAMYGADTSYNTGDTVYEFYGSEPHFLTIWDAGGSDTIDASRATGDSVIKLDDSSLSSIDMHSASEQASVKVAELSSSPYYASNYTAYIQNAYTQMDADNDLYTGENNLGIVKGVVIENVKSGSGDDYIYDNFVNNTVHAGSGNDTIYLTSGGYDAVYGEGGTDTVYVRDAASAVSVSAVSGGYSVRGSYFEALLVGVEQISYNGSVVALG